MGTHTNCLECGKSIEYETEGWGVSPELCLCEECAHDETDTTTYPEFDDCIFE